MPVETAPDSRAALSTLRQELRADPPAAPARLRVLLRDVVDPFDREAAGVLLGELPVRAGDECRVALLGSSNLDALPGLLTAALVADGVRPELRSAGYDQWRLEVLTGAPELRDLAPHLVACLLDARAVAPDDQAGAAATIAAVEAFPGQLRQWADTARDTLGGCLVLSTVPLPPYRLDRFRDARSRAAVAAAWHHMNGALLELAASSPDTVVLDAGVLGVRAGTVVAPERMRHLGAHAYSPAFLRVYADELTRVARAVRGQSRKCVVLHADGTLWRGRAADGRQAITLGGSYPGSAHRELQLVVRGLRTQGVLVAVLAPDPAAAVAALGHPESLLSPDDLVCVLPAGPDRTADLRELAHTLNLGLDALVHVDVDVTVRAELRATLPEVADVALGQDPAGFAGALLEQGGFGLLQLTDEDRERTQMYQRRGTAPSPQTDGLAGYLASLGSELQVEPACEATAPRISQLFGKTNQFNLTGARYSEQDITQSADGLRFWAGRLRDTHGDNGIVTAIAVRTSADGWTVENLVLSCRVFSRGVEVALAALLLDAARRSGAPAVSGSHRATARNANCADFYLEVGFQELPADDDGVRHFTHDLIDPPDVPTWIHVPSRPEAFDVA